MPNVEVVRFLIGLAIAVLFAIVTCDAVTDDHKSGR